MNKTEMNVKVVADDLGNVIRVSANNPDYGVIRVVEESIQFQNGWMRRKDKSALIPGFVEDLKTLNWKNGQKIAGQIVVKEALEPFNENDPDFVKTWGTEATHHRRAMKDGLSYKHNSAMVKLQEMQVEDAESRLARKKREKQDLRRKNFNRF